MIIFNKEITRQGLENLDIETLRELYDQLEIALDKAKDDEQAFGTQVLIDIVGELIEDYQNTRDEATLEDYADEYELD